MAITTRADGSPEETAAARYIKHITVSFVFGPKSFYHNPSITIG